MTSQCCCLASVCECRLTDNPCCPCGRGETDGEEQCRGRQWLTQPLKLQNVWTRASVTLLISHGALGLGEQHLQRWHQKSGTEEWRSSRALVLWAENCWDKKRGQPRPSLATIGMATASTSGQSAFGLGRKKKNPGLMDQIGKIFGGDKKKRSKVSSILSAFKGKVCVSSRRNFSMIQLRESLVSVKNLEFQVLHVKLSAYLINVCKDFYCL